MHGGECMAGTMHGGGVCVVGGACVAGGCVRGSKRPLQRAVRILLECILVL